VRRDDLDLISVAAPVDLHYPIVTSALSAHKHVLCEKPAALNAKQAGEMADLADLHGLVNAVAFEHRWTPERLAVRELLSSGFLGTPYLIQITQNLGSRHPQAAVSSPWKLQLDRGGGYMNAVACHEVDFVRYLFGEPTSVFAELRNPLRNRVLPDGSTLLADAEQTCVITLRFNNESLAVISGTELSRHGSGYHFEASGSDGVVEFTIGPGGSYAFAGRTREEERKPLEFIRRLPRDPLPDSDDVLAPQIRCMALLLEDLAQQFTGGPSRVPSLRDALRVQQVIDAARVSSGGVGWVDVASS
jgi:predicted dehydrogenase